MIIIIFHFWGTFVFSIRVLYGFMFAYILYVFVCGHAKKQFCVRKGGSRIPASNRVENLADVSTRCSGLLQGEEASARFSTLFEAGIREIPFLMPEPAEKPSLQFCVTCPKLSCCT